MGGASSQEPRAVTVEEVEEDDGQARINVTEDFLKYLRKTQSGEAEEKDTRPSSPKQTQPSEYPEDEFEDASYPSAQELLGGSSDYSRPSWSEEADEVANMWRERYESEAKKNEELKNIATEQFEKAVDNIKQKFVGTGVTLVDRECEGDRNSVLNCYRSHPGKPLDCAEEVKAYFQCVGKLRKSTASSNQD
ncbi:hypothetical protein EMCRGX_G003386 [Ephydatia muelleri]